MSEIDIFSMLIFHAELLLAVGGLLYCSHPIFEVISGVFPTWRLLLGIGKHKRCLLIDGCIFLGILQRSRCLVLTLFFLSVVVVIPF